MKKRVTAFALLLFLLINITTPVMAKLSTDDLAVVSGYAMDQDLYMFAQLDEKYTGTDLDTKVTIDGITIANKTSPVAIGESDATIKYLLMIDQSGSMNKYIDKVNAFVDALADQERANALFTIAGFGDDFKVISEGISDKEVVKSTIAGLNYNEPWTDPYNAIVKALNYVDTTSRTGGEVLNIIVVSDGKVDFGITDADKARKAENERAAAAKKKIEEAPEVLIHTFGVVEWDDLCLDTYAAGRGDNAVIDNENDATVYGKKIANYIDSLYYLDFSLKKDVGTERFALEVQMTGTDSDGTPAIMNTTLGNIPNLTNYVVKESEEDIFKIIGSAKDSDGEDSKEPISDSSDPNSKEKEDNEADIVQDTLDVKDDSADEGTKHSMNAMMIILVAVIMVCMILVVIVVCLIVRKNKQEGEKKSSSGGKIQIRLDPISGEIKKPKGKFNLSGFMIIGSSSKADIVIKADGVSRMHAKLYESNGVVYIQDISESSGVFMDGMRLQAPNRLLDGDEVTIGSARVVIRVSGRIGD